MPEFVNNAAPGGKPRRLRGELQRCLRHPAARPSGSSGWRRSACPAARSTPWPTVFADPQRAGPRQWRCRCRTAQRCRRQAGRANPHPHVAHAAAGIPLRPTAAGAPTRRPCWAGFIGPGIRRHRKARRRGDHMKTQSIDVPMRDGTVMPCYLRHPGRPARGCRHPRSWRYGASTRRCATTRTNSLRPGSSAWSPTCSSARNPGVQLSDGDPADIRHAFDLYYDFDYDQCVLDMEDTAAFLKTLPACNGRVGAVGYCLGGKLCYLMCCRTDIDACVAYYGTYIEHNIREARQPAPALRAAHGDAGPAGVQAEVNELLERRLSPNPLVTIPQISRRRPRLRPHRAAAPTANRKPTERCRRFRSISFTSISHDRCLLPRRPADDLRPPARFGAGQPIVERVQGTAGALGPGPAIWRCSTSSPGYQQIPSLANPPLEYVAAPDRSPRTGALHQR